MQKPTILILRIYDSKKDNNYIMYYDANNPYGWAMSQPLPYPVFKWKEIKDGKFYSEKGKGYILEVDLEYPKHLHKSHNDYPLAPDTTRRERRMALRVSNRAAVK